MFRDHVKLIATMSIQPESQCLAPVFIFCIDGRLHIRNEQRLYKASGKIVSTKYGQMDREKFYTK